MRYLGVQTYCLARTGMSLPEKLRKIADLGYTHVEFAGFDNLEPQRVLDLLNETKLIVAGSHERYDTFADRLDQIISFNKAIGNQYVAIPRPLLKAGSDVLNLIDNINSWRKILFEAGLQLYYHNHDFEFREIDGIVPMTAILEQTQVLLEVDTYWTYRAGVDVIEFVKANRKRMLSIHLKDGDENASTSIGLGILPCKAYYETAARYGLGIIVEDDSQLPDGVSSIANSIKTIKQFYKP